MPSNHFTLCRPLLRLPSIFPSIRVFSNESALRIRWPKDWSFSISLPSDYSGLVSFRIDWFEILAVQGTLKNLLQNHSSKASILWCSSFFMVQFSHPYVTIEKTVVFTIWTFVGKVISLLFFFNFIYFFYFLNFKIFNSYMHSCPTLCDPMNCSMPDLPVHHQLPEFTQIHVHRVSDAIQPSHPLSSPSPPAPNPSQHQSLFQ